MNIGIDIRHLAAPNPSGVGIYTIRLIEELAQNNPDDVFLLFASGSKKALASLPNFQKKNIQLIKKELPNKIIFLLLKMPFGPKLEDWMPVKPELWFFPNFNIVRTSIPYILTVHDLSFLLYKEFFTYKNRLKHWLNGTKRLLKDASSLLAVSESTKMDIVNMIGIEEDKIIVTTLAADQIYHPKEQASDKSFLQRYKICFPYFLTLSTLEPRKNIVSVIEAYDSWRIQKKKSGTKKIPHLVIAGGKGWKSKDVRRAIESSSFKKDMHLIGYVAENHKPALYRHTKAFFFPSFYEGFGLPLLEAMACNATAVCSFTSSMPEVAKDAAIMIDPYNVSDIEQAFVEIDRSANLLDGKGPLQASKFHWKKTAIKTRDSFNQTK